MSTSDRKPPKPPVDASKRSGRVTHDARGNPVWEWQTSTGVFSKDVSTQRLKKLEAPELSLMDTQSVAKHKDKDKNKEAKSAGKSGLHPKLDIQESGRHPIGGFNPYDNDGKRKTPKRVATEFDAQRHHPAIAHKQQPVRKDPPRQSLQTKYASSSPKSDNKPQGLLGKIKSVFGGDK